MKQQLRSNFKQAKGFTLIELIIVIIILGILAVTAAPKFIDLQGDARKSSLKGLQGAISSSVTVLYAKAALTNKLKTFGDSVEGVDTDYGVPKATAGALQEAAGFTSADFTVVAGTTAAAGTSTTAGTAGTAYVHFAGDTYADVAAITAANCYVLYTSSTDDGSGGYTNAVAAITNSGC